MTTDTLAWAIESIRKQAREPIRKLVEASLGDNLSPAQEKEIDTLLNRLIDDENRRRVTSKPSLSPIAEADRDEIITAVSDFYFRMGSLQRLIDDPDVEEVIVNGHDEGFVIRIGGWKETFDPGFSSDDELRGFIQRAVAGSGRRVDHSSPTADVSLDGGARLHAVLPPIGKRSYLTIRCHRLVAHSLKELTDLGTVTDEAADFLRAAVAARCNILISGGTASGKTTFLNALGDAIPADERVVVIEETAELRLFEKLADSPSLEARRANSEGVGNISLRDLVREALRMRPQRIIVGEVRGAEALEMISAMNTGHEGSLSTIHANDARQAISKLSVYMSYAEERLPAEVISRLIAETLHLVVHLRLENGQRRLAQVMEIAGLQGGVVLGNELFRTDESGTLSRTPLQVRHPRLKELTARPT